MKEENVVGGIFIAVLFALVLLCCYGIDCAKEKVKTKAEKQPTEHVYVVEEKQIYGVWRGKEQFSLIVSDTLSHNPTMKYVGKHTYETTNVGDTIKFFE